MSESTPPYAAWIVDLKRGKPAAARDLYRATSRELFRYCLAMAGRESEAEELMQEAYLKAFGQIQSLKEPERFRHWLFKIARNQWLNTKRASEHDIGRSSLPEMLDPHSSGEGEATSRLDRIADDAASDPELALSLQARLMALKPESRQIILLVDVEGMTHSEASAILSISEESSRIRLFRARKELVKLFDDEVTK